MMPFDRLASEERDQTFGAFAAHCSTCAAAVQPRLDVAEIDEMEEDNSYRVREPDSRLVLLGYSNSS